MTTTETGFGELLRRYRIAAGLTQEELAERAGVSTRGISDLERGARGLPRKDTLLLLLQALDLAPADCATLTTAARRRPAPAPEGDPATSHRDLPVSLTPLIGREAEISAVAALLREPAVRLVTLTGPGGTGKTRLAIAVAEQLTGDFRDGVIFVPLAPLGDPAFVANEIAQRLGVRERAGQRLTDVLKTHLSDKRLLLVLDNFEHLLPAAALVSDVVAACPSVRVLATSRAPLHLSGERTYAVSPLALPDPTQLPPLEDLDQAEAVRLFVVRVQALKPDFALNATNAPAVVEIVHRLEGLPLALELAAARVRVISPATLLARLDRSLPLLTGGAQDLPARQRTMRDAIAWSYDLLPESEKTLLRSLAVFVGGWTFEAAEALSGGTGGLDVLDGLESLMAASLVHAVEQTDDERRFGMLDTVRQFGMERLVVHGEAEELGHRHADYFLRLAQAGAAALGGAAQGGWLTRVAAEQANLRAALAWLRDHEAGETGLRLATDLGVFWHIRSANAEARTWLETFLAQAPAATPTADRVLALGWAGEFAGLQGDKVAAEVHLIQSLTLARQVGDKRGIALALRAIGSAALLHGDVAASIAPFTEAAGIAREIEDLRLTAFLLAFLAYAVGHQGDLTRAEALVTETDILLRALQDTDSFEANLALLSRGLLALMDGAYEQARPHLEAALGTGRAIGAKGTISVALGALAELALANGDFEAAAQHYREGLVIGWEGDFPMGVVFNLTGLARLASCGSELVMAARVVGMVDTLRGAIQALLPAVITAYEASVASMRAALGDAAFSAARAAGRALSVESAVTEALALADEMTGSGPRPIQLGHPVSDVTC